MRIVRRHWIGFCEKRRYNCFIMKINIKATKLELTPAITEYVNMKVGSLERFVKKFEEKGEIEAIVEIARTTRHHNRGNVYYAETNLNLKGTILRAEYIDEDIRAAIDKMKDVLKIEIKKHKDKIKKDKSLLRSKKRSGSGE